MPLSELIEDHSTEAKFTYAFLLMVRNTLWRGWVRCIWYKMWDMSNSEKLAGVYVNIGLVFVIFFM